MTNVPECGQVSVRNLTKIEGLLDQNSIFSLYLPQKFSIFALNLTKIEGLLDQKWRLSLKELDQNDERRTFDHHQMWRKQPSAI